MDKELQRLIGALNAVTDSSENKDVKAIAKALVRYFDNAEDPMGFTGKEKHNE